MIKKLVFDDYKPFGGHHEIEIRPFTLIIGKNSSGKSSITHLISMMSELIGNHKPVPYKSFTGDYISTYTFHNLQTTGLKLGLVNDNGFELDLSFVRNVGRRYLYKVDVKHNDELVHVIDFSSGEPKELTDRVDFLDPILSDWDLSLANWSYSTNYLAPVRSIPDSVFAFNSTNVGEVRSKGENVYDILVDSYRGNKVLLNKVSKWLYENMDHQKLSVDPLVAEFYSIDVDNGRGASVPIEEVGEGVSQVLPIIVQSYLDKKSDVTIIEQPVLHLHPAAHASVADRLIESVVMDKKTYVVESHSPNVLLALRRAICNPNIGLSSKDVAVYFVDSESDNPIKMIEILDNGDLTSWPTGIFGESFELMKDILRLKK